MISTLVEAPCHNKLLHGPVLSSAHLKFHHLLKYSVINRHEGRFSARLHLQKAFSSIQWPSCCAKSAWNHTFPCGRPFCKNAGHLSCLQTEVPQGIHPTQRCGKRVCPDCTESPHTTPDPTRLLCFHEYPPFSRKTYAQLNHLKTQWLQKDL